MELNKPKNNSLLTIRLLMERGVISNPYEITEEDFREHRHIDILGGFGFVQRSDIGKRVFLRDGHLQMENDQQMETRKKNEKMFPNFKTNLRFEK